MKDSYREKTEQLDTAMATKMPRTYKYVGVFREVWRETFPDYEGSTKSRMDKRREQAKKMREYEENELSPEEAE